MKIDDRIPHRSRMLLFSTLELLRKEIHPKFSDWKDADDWLFSQLDFTKDELALIYKGRNTLYHDASAVDIEAAKKDYEESIPKFLRPLDVLTLGQSVYLKGNRFFLGDNGSLLCQLHDETEPRNLRSRIQDIKQGDAFFFGDSGAIRTTSDDLYIDRDNQSRLCVYGDDGDVYFEEDIGSKIGFELKDFLVALSQKEASKSALEDQIQSASTRAIKPCSVNKTPAKDSVQEI